MCTPKASQRMSKPTTMKPATSGASSTSAHLRGVGRRRVLRRPFPAPHASEVGDDIECELHDEQHRTGAQKQARRIEREADRAHGGFADLPAVGKLPEAVPGEEAEEHERDEM